MKKKYVVSTLPLLFLFVACTSKEPQACPLPPERFSESDLVGTWGGDIETVWDSAIIISKDGWYKQSINIKRTEFQYEGDWRRWRVTYSEQGLPYLHLEGLLMCAYWGQMDCTGQTSMTPLSPGGTQDIYGDAAYWYDYCREEWVETPGEGVFIIFGYKRLPRGIALVSFTKSADGVSGPYYELREP